MHLTRVLCGPQASRAEASSSAERLANTVRALTVERDGLCRRLEALAAALAASEAALEASRQQMADELAATTRLLRAKEVEARCVRAAAPRVRTARAADTRLAAPPVAVALSYLLAKLHDKYAAESASPPPQPAAARA